MKKLSPFSKEFWIAKGYSESDAEYKRNSIRPIKPEYWLERGHSMQEALILAADHKDKNNKKGARSSANRPLEEHKLSSPRCIEYWLAKGYSTEDAKTHLRQAQQTFTLESCVEKYGAIEGYSIWKNRQDKWQSTLNNKSSVEKIVLNAKKNRFDRSRFDSIDELIQYAKTKDISLVKTLDEFSALVDADLLTNPHKRYQFVEHYIEKNIKQTQIKIFEELNLDYVSVIRNKFKPIEHFNQTGLNRAYRRWQREGLLRSSYEIFFYDMVKQLHPNIEVSIDGYYPNSRMRYDFKINDIFIEICPLYDTNEKYRMKMDKKKDTFKCVLLKDTDDITKFITTL